MNYTPPIWDKQKDKIQQAQTG